jgi:reductive dehalogenase
MSNERGDSNNSETPAEQAAQIEQTAGAKSGDSHDLLNDPERRLFFKRIAVGGGGALLAGAGAYGAGRLSVKGSPAPGPEIDETIFKPMDQRNTILTFVHSKALNRKHPERNEQYNRLQNKEFNFNTGFRDMYSLPWDNSKPGYTQKDRALQKAGWHPLEVAGSRFSANLQPNTPLHSWDQSDVEQEQYQFKSKKEASDSIKSAARVFGVVKCGITRRDKRWDYDPLYDPVEEKELSWEDDFPFEPKTVIVLLIAADFDCIATAPAWTSDGSYGDGYSQMGVKADQIAKFIRGLGYHAVSAGNDLGNSVAYSIMAGLGEGGRNGQLLAPGVGPRVRIAKVYTDLDFVEYDQPHNWGITDFCLTCGKCAEACPSDALPLPEDKNGGYGIEPSYEFSDEPGYTWNNQPGVRKFYTDAKKCYNFWVENGGACGACIASCTFNEPDVWHHWFIMAINPIAPGFLHGLMAEAHPAFGYGHTNDPRKALKFWKTGEGMRTNIHMKNNIGTSNKS